MTTNKYKRHVLILPEDDANRQVANGFALEVRHIRQLQVLPVSGGWHAAVEAFETEHAGVMRSNPYRHLIILIDFDGEDGRADFLRSRIPDDLKERVFILGCKTEPEELKRAGLGSYEAIGKRLAVECGVTDKGIWAHELLYQNLAELQRLRASVCDILM